MLGSVALLKHNERDMTKIDTLSPAFFGGFIGLAVTGDEAGFFVGAVVTWVTLTFGIVVLALLEDSRQAQQVDADAAHIPAE